MSTEKRQNMKKELLNFKRALEEHLSAINENTSEIQVVFDYLQEVETKVDKLNHRLDEMQLTQGLPLSKPCITSLSHDEKTVFLILYTEEKPLTMEEISERTHLSLSLIVDLISALTKKGIPLQRSYANEQFFFSLNPEFKEIQAKENLVNLSLESFI